MSVPIPQELPVGKHPQGAVPRLESLRDRDAGSVELADPVWPGSVPVCWTPPILKASLHVHLPGQIQSNAGAVQPRPYLRGHSDSHPTKGLAAWPEFDEGPLLLGLPFAPMQQIEHTLGTRRLPGAPARDLEENRYSPFPPPPSSQGWRRDG